jgi:hypothetical protein
MKLEIAKKWTTALRNGKYKGTKGRLAKFNKQGNPMGFCCLGVLCKLYENEYPKDPIGNWNVAFPPEKVRKWAGLKTENGRYTADKHGNRRNLVKQNDEQKRGFKGIANIIDKHVNDL